MLLAKDAVEPFMGGSSFSKVCVPKCRGGLQSSHNHNPINHYVQIPSLKMPTVRQVWQLIQQGDYSLSIDPKDTYLHTTF